uniref:Putative polysaccharide pyruvyl transferase family protein n=1 Tax=viral metagenome TaxID=1070528 RepID=A0A6M3K9Z8_9ZZZZ
MDKAIEEVLKKGTPLVCIHPIPNYGDLLNIPIVTALLGRDAAFGSYQMLTEVPKDVNIFIGIGTLVGYIIPTEWFRNRKVTFLGTGAVERPMDRSVFNSAQGFVRGPVSAQTTGLPAGGDLAMLLHTVYPAKTFAKNRKEKTAVVIDKFDSPYLLDLPNQDKFSAFNVKVDGLLGIYERIASATMVVTDRLHVATTAELCHIPWILWDHEGGDLYTHHEKFKDWASSIDKEKFITQSLHNIEVIKDNTDFSASDNQIKELRGEIKQWLAK